MDETYMLPLLLLAHDTRYQEKRPHQITIPPSLPSSPSLPPALPTYVLDCIDDIQTKSELLSYCKDQNLRVICSLGAGLKADPTRLCIG